MSKWGEYKYALLDDDEKRADVCGIDKDKIKKGIPAIILKYPIEIARIHAEAIYKQGPWPKFYFSNKGYGGIARKTYITQVKGKLVTNLWPYTEVGHTDEAKKEITKIFDGKKKFDTPKPVRLLKRILQIVPSENSKVLDFFAGSGTTLHATMQLNEEDSGHRQCIICQINENNICSDVTYERNRRIIQGYSDRKRNAIPGLGNSLKYYRTAFVGNNLPKSATDDDKLALAKKAGCLLGLAENTLYETEATDYYQFYTDNHGEWTCIYYQEDYCLFDEFRRKVLALDGRKKNVYVFCWTDGSEFAAEFEFKKDVTVKNIPQPILDIYKSLNT